MSKLNKIKVEVKQGDSGTRVLARLFADAPTAMRFFEATRNAHQQRANREGCWFTLRMTIVQERPAKELDLLDEVTIDPLSH